MAEPGYTTGKVLKWIDLLVQSVVIIAFLAFASVGDELGYLMMFFGIGSWHLLGALVHIVPSWPGKLVRERRLYWLGVILFFLAVAVIWNMPGGDSHETAEYIAFAVASVLGLWYYTICFRELMGLHSQPPF